MDMVGVLSACLFKLAEDLNDFDIGLRGDLLFEIYDFFDVAEGGSIGSTCLTGLNVSTGEAGSILMTGAMV